MSVAALPENPAPKLIFRDSAFEQNKKDAIHRWVPWIAGFSAGFVTDTFRHYLPEPRSREVVVLEPFAGVGTTLVEGLLHGYNVAGFEVNPYAALACRVKCTAFEIDPGQLMQQIVDLEHRARRRTESLDAAFIVGDDPLHCMPVPMHQPPKLFRSRAPFFSPTVERKILHCLDVISEIPDPMIRDLAALAFGAILVQISNYSYEPSLGSRAAAGKPDVPNADVVGILTSKLRSMHEDLLPYKAAMDQYRPLPTAQVRLESSLNIPALLEPGSADIVVTSPPYLNNYHYIRNTRPHLFWLNFVASPGDLRSIETANFGKYWQTVRDTPPADLNFALPDLEAHIEGIAAMHPEKGIYGGQGWANYAVQYFNDCKQICQGLRHALKPNGVAVFVLGNSIVQGIELATDRYFGRIGELCGLRLEDIHLLREKRIGNSVVNSSVRNGEATRATLYETAVVLRQSAVS